MLFPCMLVHSLGLILRVCSFPGLPDIHHLDLSDNRITDVAVVRMLQVFAKNMDCSTFDR
jgi:hypothetical protein